MGWFGSLVHAVTHPGELVPGAEHGLGTLIDDGAHPASRTTSFATPSVAQSSITRLAPRTA